MTINVFREPKTTLHNPTMGEFKELFLPYTVRDKSVNRDGVWDYGQRKGYLSMCMVGYGDKTLIHLVDLQKLYKLVTENPSQRDIAFANYIKVFLDAGYLYAHLDGGNRCDTLDYALGIKTDEEVKISKGDYQFQPVGEDEYVYTQYVDKDMTLAEVEETYPELYKKFMNQRLMVHMWEDLTQEERGMVFRILNAGVTLNAMELRNPTVSAIATGIRNKLDEEYKDLFVSAGVLKEGDAKRFGFMDWILRNSYAYNLARNGSSLPYLGGKKDLDSAFKANSQQDKNYPSYEKFFEKTLVPYVKIMLKKKEKLFKKNAWNDFSYVLVYMIANNMKIPNVNAEGRYALINAYNEWLVERCADKDTIYKKIKANYQGFFNDLFSKNANNVVKIRSKEIREKFIPRVLEKGIIVKIDEEGLFNDQQKAEMWVKDNVTSEGVEIPAGKLRGNEFQADHVFPKSKGGETTVDNGKLEGGEYNRKKLASIVENPIAENG